MQLKQKNKHIKSDQFDLPIASKKEQQNYGQFWECLGEFVDTAAWRCALARRSDSDLFAADFNSKIRIAVTKVLVDEYDHGYDEALSGQNTYKLIISLQISE